MKVKLPLWCQWTDVPVLGQQLSVAEEFVDYLGLGDHRQQGKNT